jgi:cell division protein FtsB
MGKSQKKSNKLQQKQKAGMKLPFNFKGLKFFDSLTNKFSIHNRFAKIALGALLSITLICIFCYAPAKTYYTELRNTQKYAAELEALEARNETLKSNVESLNTDQGIEDKAKSEYGYVKEGEGSALVQGIERQQTYTLPTYVDSSKIEVESYWYTPALDFIFGYNA